MNQTKIGNRFVVIGGNPLQNEVARNRELTEQRPTAQRIVVIRNGKLVGRRRGR